MFHSRLRANNRDKNGGDYRLFLRLTMSPSGVGLFFCGGRMLFEGFRGAPKKELCAYGMSRDRNAFLVSRGREERRG